MSEFMSEQIGELAKALAAAQQDMNPASKNASNPMLRNKYADLASCIAAARASLPAHGLAVSQIVEPTDGRTVSVVTMLMHESGQWIQGRCILPIPAEHKGINAAQAAGSYITYARRYGLSSIIGLATDDDDDGCGGQRADTSRPQQGNRKPAQGNQQNEPQKAAQKPEQAQVREQTPDEILHAKVAAIYKRVQEAGFQSAEDCLAEISRMAGKSISRLGELSLDDAKRVEAAIANGGIPDNPF